ncbi:MAG: BA14K family protein [Rhizobiaceae bacterium]|jgi:hypothetical protein|nr:BA14K family protein [Rhizobiaceae bacterium]
MTSSASSFKKATITTLAIATIATAASFAAPQNAHAGSKAFWRGAAAGAVAGVVTGAIINNNRRHRRVYVERRHAPRTVYVQREVVHTGSAHVDWCLSRYRSYDVRSDTYQPYSGPRRYCNSPYN